MKTGIFLSLFPQLGVVFVVLGIFIAIFGAILTQTFVEYSNRKFLTFLIPTIIGVLYFLVVSEDFIIFLLATAAFLAIQGMYYSVRKFKESINTLRS